MLGLNDDDMVEQGWPSTTLVLNKCILSCKVYFEFQASCKDLDRKKAEALKWGKAYFPKHTFYYCTKKSTPTPLFVSPTQPPRELYMVYRAGVTEDFCSVPCPQAELSAPGPFRCLAISSWGKGVPAHTYSLAELGLG